MSDGPYIHTLIRIRFWRVIHFGQYILWGFFEVQIKKSVITCKQIKSWLNRQNWQIQNPNYIFRNSEQWNIGTMVGANLWENHVLRILLPVMGSLTWSQSWNQIRNPQTHIGVCACIDSTEVKLLFFSFQIHYTLPCMNHPLRGQPKFEFIIISPCTT
jgi:hypothetical protein